MLIAHVHFTVTPEHREAALEILLAECAAVRAMTGCVTFLPFVDPGASGSLGVLHEWEREEDFAVYTSSPGFAAMRAALRPIMTAAPVSRRFDATLLVTVN